MVGVKIGVVGVVGVEIGNPWVLDYWFFWVSMGVGYGRGDRCGCGEGNGDNS